jgi:glycerol-3-phosphate acyltransferase PlsY
MSFAILCVASFLLGSIPVGLIIAKARGIDIRKRGSGNIGATNVMRTVGKKEALMTLIGDILKGFVPVLVAWNVVSNTLLVGVVGIAAVSGHIFSVFLKFRGGKGVATSLGVLLAYSPVTALITIAIWITVFLITKISSLSALIAFIMLPVITFLINHGEGKFLISLIITILVVIKHKDNIRRLFSGNESGIGQSA